MMPLTIQEPNTPWSNRPTNTGAAGLADGHGNKIRKLLCDLQYSKRALERQCSLHKAHADVNAKLQDEMNEIQSRTDDLENRRKPQLCEQQKMAAEELESWKRKFEDQKALRAKWIANGRAHLTEILNTLERDKAQIRERRRAVKEKLGELQGSKASSCLKADVEQLKDVAVALETKLPVHEKRVVQLKAAKREIKSKVARKRKEYKQLLAELKRLKPQEKVRKRKARARRQAWLGPTPPFYIDRPTSDSRVHTGLVFEKVTIPDNESGTSYTEKVLRRSGVVPILYYCDGVPLMSEGGGTPPIKPYLLHTIREERSPVDNGQVQDDINIRTENEVASQKEHSIEHMEQGSEGFPRSTHTSVRSTVSSPRSHSSPLIPRGTASSEARATATAKKIQSLIVKDADKPFKAQPCPTFCRPFIPKKSRKETTSTLPAKVFWTDYRAWRQENECKPYIQEQRRLREMRKHALQEMKNAEEERKWKQWRKKHQFKAQPMPDFGEPALEHYSKRLPTVPSAPQLRADERMNTKKLPKKEANSVYTKLREQYISRARRQATQQFQHKA